MLSRKIEAMVATDRNKDDRITKVELRLINDMRSSIIQSLLVQSGKLIQNLECAREEKDQCAMRLDILLNELRVNFKEKMFEQVKKKLMRELPLDEFTSGMSMTESELKNLEEQCKVQNSFEIKIELLLDKSYLSKKIDQNDEESSMSSMSIMALEYQSFHKRQEQKQKLLEEIKSMLDNDLRHCSDRSSLYQ